MPPRKSTASITSNGAEDGAETTPARQVKDGMSVEDLSLPKSMISRLAKGVLPANHQIHKEALLALHKSATVFVSYIASNSNEIAQSGGKKTISPQDVMAAMKDCEFEGFLPRLEAELKKYNEVQCDKRNTYRRKVKEEKAAAATTKDGLEGGADGAVTEGPNGTAVNGRHDEGEDEDRPAKKLKGEDGTAMVSSPDDAEDEVMDGDQDGQQDEPDDQQDDDDDVESVDDDEDEQEIEVSGAPDDSELDDDVRVGPDMRDEALDDPNSDSD